MFIILMCFALVCVYSMKIMPVKEFNTGYISRDDSTAVKGIFVFMVFISHFTQYYHMSTAFDNPYKALKVFLSQLIVVVFLFYSGYGVFESIKRKGSGYIKSFPVNRCLKVLFHFDIAILIFLAFGFAMGKTYKPVKILLSLIGWESVGNSNWFIFVIVVLYLLVFISFSIFKKNNLAGIIATTLLTVAFIIALAQFKDTYWFDTALCLPAGMWYSYFKDKIEKLVMKNNVTYLITAAVIVALFFVAYKFKDNIAVSELWAILFALVILIVTMKVKIGNKVLMWLGNHVFSVYILQRLPMTAFSKVEFISSNRYIYFFASLAVTVVISELFDRAMAVIDKKLFVPRKK